MAWEYFTAALTTEDLFSGDARAELAAAIGERAAAMDFADDGYGADSATQAVLDASDLFIDAVAITPGTDGLCFSALNACAKNYLAADDAPDLITASAWYYYDDLAALVGAVLGISAADVQEAIASDMESADFWNICRTAVQALAWPSIKTFPFSLNPTYPPPYRAKVSGANYSTQALAASACVGASEADFAGNYSYRLESCYSLMNYTAPDPPYDDGGYAAQVIRVPLNLSIKDFAPYSAGYAVFWFGSNDTSSGDLDVLVFDGTSSADSVVAGGRGDFGSGVTAVGPIEVDLRKQSYDDASILQGVGAYPGNNQSVTRLAFAPSFTHP